MEHTKNALHIAITSATLGLLLAQAAAAQMLEETIVTARKVESSLQTTPVAMSTVSGEELARQNIVNIVDVETPNAIINGGGSPQRANISIRGAATTQTDPFQAPSISVVKDGLVSDTFATNGTNLFDTARVEILKGPQGTLFGRNSVAGLVNIISNRPNINTLELDASLAAENYSTTDLRVTINFPVNDTFALRFAALKRDSDGWGSRTNATASTYDHIAPQGAGPFLFPVDPQNPADGLPASQLLGKIKNGSGDLGMDPGEIDHLALRGSLLWAPTDKLTFTLIAEWEDSEAGQLNITPVTREDEPVGLLGFSGADVDSGNVHKTGQDLYNTLPYDTTTVMGEIKWDLSGSLSLTSITGFKDESAFIPFDVDGYDQQFLTSLQTWDVETVSQELTLTSSFSGRFNFVAGAYYSESTLDKIQESFLSRDMLCQDVFGTTDVGIPVPGPLFGCPIGSFTAGQDGFQGPLSTIIPNWSKVDQNTEAKALYGQVYFNISEAINLTVGGRYSEEEKELFNDFIRGGTAFDEGDLFPHTAKDDWSNFSPMASIDYQLTDDIMGYLSYSEGFRSGGFNGRSNSFVTIFSPYDEETAASWEVGIKSEFWNNRLRLNAALFTAEYNDLQRDIQGIDDLDNVSVFVLNAAAATVTGFELDFVALLTERLTLRGGLGLMDGEYDEFNPDLPPGFASQADPSEFESFTLPYTPEVTANLGATYVVPVGDSSLTFDATVNYTDEMLTLVVDTPESTRDSVTLVSAGATWRINESFNIKVYGRNLTDEETMLVAYSWGSPWGRGQIYGAPRSYGISLNYRM